MPATFLSMAWGHPKKIIRDEKNTDKESWYYSEPGDNKDADTEVVIENNKVVILKET